MTAVALAFLLLVVPPTADSTAARDRSVPLPDSPLESDEILWLARCIYSESDRPDEQRLVAWVVRNRVETGFRGATYREVVLEERQFSAFNHPTPRRDRILSLTPADREPAWQRALDIAGEVYHARPSERPFPVTTRHFYSPVSMVGRAAPDWAADRQPLHLAALNVDPQRFRFFDGIDEGLDVAVENSSVRTHLEAVVGQMRRARRSLRLSGRIARPIPPAQPSRKSR